MSSQSEGFSNNIKYAAGGALDYQPLDIDYFEMPVEYDASKNNSNFDFAIINLKSKVKSSKPLESSYDGDETDEDYYVGERLITCGFGSIDNFRNKSKELLCASLRVVPIVECGEIYVGKGLICTQNNDASNVCGGDIGKIS